MGDYFEPFRPMSMVPLGEEQKSEGLWAALNPKPRTHVAPMVTLTRLVDGVPGETLRARWEPGVTIGNTAFFAPRPGEDGKKIGFTITFPGGPVPHSGGYSIGMEGLDVREFPMWPTNKSDLPGYTRAFAALQRKGVR